MSEANSIFVPGFIGLDVFNNETRWKRGISGPDPWVVGTGITILSCRENVAMRLHLYKSFVEHLDANQSNKNHASKILVSYRVNYY